MKKLFFVICTLFILASCQNESEILTTNKTTDITSGVSCVNGELFFESSESFYKTIDFINSAENQELDEWEQKLGFVSFRKIKNDLLDDLESITDEGEYLHTIALNNDIVKLDNDRIVFKLNDKIYSSITNRKGIYHVNNNMILVSNDKLFSSSVKDLHNFDENEKNEDVKEMIYVVKDKLKSTNCGTFLSAYATNADNDRRVFVETFLEKVWDGYSYYTSHPDGMNYTVLLLYVKVYGEKKNLFGSWISYETALTFRNGNFNVYVPYDNSLLQPNPIWSISNWSATTSNDLREFYQWRAINIYPGLVYPGGIYLQNNLSIYNFTNAQVEASSRGLQMSQYASISCGY